MNNETGKLSFDKLFLLSGIYALFYTFCLYRNRMVKKDLWGGL